MTTQNPEPSAEGFTPEEMNKLEFIKKVHRDSGMAYPWDKHHLVDHQQQENDIIPEEEKQPEENKEEAE